MPGQQGQQQPGFGQQFLLLQRLQALGKPQDQLGIAVALGILVSLKNGLVKGFKLVLGFALFQQATALFAWKTMRFTGQREVSSPVSLDSCGT